jgi:hypothetical protein
MRTGSRERGSGKPSSPYREVPGGWPARHGGDADLEGRALDITTISDRLMAEAEAFIEMMRGGGTWPPAEDEEEPRAERAMGRRRRQ